MIMMNLTMMMTLMMSMMTMIIDNGDEDVDDDGLS